MFLSLSTTYAPATDLGHLLHKHPEKAHSFSIHCGRGRVFYSEASKERCTVCLHMDADPVRLASCGDGDAYLDDMAHSGGAMLAVALRKAFHSAMAGRCQERPGLAVAAIPLSLFLPVVSCRRGESFLRGLFEPLGYRVEAERLSLNSMNPGGGQSRFFSLNLSHCLPLKDLLAHLYILLPVLDGRKHYRAGLPDVGKLLRYGKGWLFCHPAKEAILWRSLQGRKPLIQAVLERLPSPPPEKGIAEPEPMPFPELAGLNEQRIRAVLEVLVQSGVKSLVDLGCGEGRLLRQALEHGQFHKLLGIDVSGAALAKAASRLKPSDASACLELKQGSLFYRDSRYRAFDAAAAVEVIEHLELERLPCFEEVLFGFARPGVVVITTPNFEYNARLFWIPAGAFRHGDHRFEWTRQQFSQWADALAERRGYDVKCLPVGPEHPVYGAPSQMAVFTRRDPLRDSEPLCNAVPSLDGLVGGCRVESAMGRLRLREKDASRALELLSRFGMDPRWLVYLPGFVPSPAASAHPDYLEHPKEAFEYYRKAGLRHVVCREKPMGERVTLVLCRSLDAALRRFGVPGLGVCCTGSGRRFFRESNEEGAFFALLQQAFESVGFWEKYHTDWACLECVMMPWAGRADGLFKYRFASLAAAAEADLSAAVEAMTSRGNEASDALKERLSLNRKFQEICRVGAARVSDWRMMPLALLATEGANHMGKSPLWQASVMTELCRFGAGHLKAPSWHSVDLGDEGSDDGAVRWWEALTASGAAGMVVMPESPSPRRLIQPALQVRGREFLRLIFGPEYTLPLHLQQLKQRRTLLKRNKALRQHALNREALDRFIAREGLDRVHECVFAVLGLK